METFEDVVDELSSEYAKLYDGCDTMNPEEFNELLKSLVDAQNRLCNLCKVVCVALISGYVVSLFVFG